jgi:hypothetical protein
VEKYGRAGQATDDNMAHAHCMLDKKGYKHAIRRCFMFFYGNNGYANALQFNAYFTLSVLFFLSVYPLTC